MVQVRCPRTCGREAEIAQLLAALDAVRTRQGRLALLTGAAGIGKSRLVGEVVAAAETRGMATAVGRATPTSGSVPYGPLTQAVLQLLRGRSLPADETFERWRAPLAPILGSVAPGAGSGGPSPVVRAEALVQLLRRLTTDGGAVLALEDLHWADEDTLTLLEYLADAVVAQPVMWLLTCRDDPGAAVTRLVDRLRERRAALHLQLDRLSAAEVAQIVYACRPDAVADTVVRVQARAEGVPLFVEELLASVGIPESFGEAVRARLAELTDVDRQVLEAAAVLGRQVAWELLPGVTGLATERVWQALDRGTEHGLLIREGAVLRFRHALTRDAVADSIQPPRRQDIARSALAELDRANGSAELTGLAADLALQAGDSLRAGQLLAASGAKALAEGALATAVETLRQARTLLDPRVGAADVQLTLVRALTAAGDVDDALAEGERLVVALRTGGGDRLAEAHIALAEAAAMGARWTLADRYLGAAGLPAPDRDDGLNAQASVLAAEVAFALQDVDEARKRLAAPLSDGEIDDEIRCRAFELLGRIERLTDLGAARAAFEHARATAQRANLPVRLLQALHELGTLELFDHAGTRRLSEAREMAQRLGALGTAAVLDLQLAAASLSRFATNEAERHARAAVAVSERLGLHAVTAKALCELAETCVQRRREAEMEHYLALAAAADPGEPFTPAFAWGQCRGMLALFNDDWDTALTSFGRGVTLLGAVAHPEPVEFRALWPLLLAHHADPQAEEELGRARAASLVVAFANRGILGYAHAILAGRAGHREEAASAALGADAYLVRFPFWANLARLCAAEAAQADGWGHPDRWLSDAAASFAMLGLDPLVDRCRRVQRQRQPANAMPADITRREAEVLQLLAQGLANKQIGIRLNLSPRTVEKHVESLLRKTGSRSRTQLAADAARGETT